MPTLARRSPSARPPFRARARGFRARTGRRSARAAAHCRSAPCRRRRPDWALATTAREESRNSPTFNCRWRQAVRPRSSCAWRSMVGDGSTKGENRIKTILPLRWCGKQRDLRLLGADLSLRFLQPSRVAGGRFLAEHEKLDHEENPERRRRLVAGKDGPVILFPWETGNIVDQWVRGGCGSGLDWRRGRTGHASSSGRLPAPIRKESGTARRPARDQASGWPAGGGFIEFAVGWRGKVDRTAPTSPLSRPPHSR